MSGARGAVRSGRAWVMADDNINTDLIMPSETFKKPVSEQVRLVFRDYRPGWAEKVGEGDILLAGRNFGTGSSRPAPQLLRLLGVGAVVAESFNGLFYRNCINYGLLALECPGAPAAAAEGDRVEVDAEAGTLRAAASGAVLQGTATPPLLMEIIRSGGLLERLRSEGYV